MSKIALVALVWVSMFICGCTYQSSMEIGTQFTTNQVSQISKNITSKEDLIEIFGEPSIKSVVSGNSEKWVYSYTGGTTSVDSLTMNIDSDISTHILDVLIEDGVVVNFAETDSKSNFISYK